MDDVRSKGVLLATFLMVICCDVAFSLGCSLKQADIVFVVDASCSIGDENWSKQLNFVVDVINSFEVGHAKVRIGMITFNSEVKNQFHLNLFNDTAAIVRKVKGTKYTRGGTQTWKVVQYLLTQSFTKANGSRSGVPHIAIFLTDGYSANTRLTISEAARLRANKIRVFAIGVGPRLNMEELNALGTDSESVFIVSHFNALNETKTKILEKACTEPPDPCYSHPCLNDGTCILRGGADFTCSCHPEYSGNYCGNELPDPCYSNPCLKDGICILRGGADFICSCHPGYSGNYCENELPDPCHSHPCLNNGTCTLRGGSDFTCSCHPGYSGNYCENDNCDGNLCTNGATCVRKIGGYNCSCTENYTHTYCHVRDCGEAPTVQNGWLHQTIRESDNQTGRQEASYHCCTGYDLIGEWNISCQDNGTWQSPPKCQSKDCGNPPNVSDSNVKYGATTFRSNASYTCDETHYMLGSSNTICEKDGIWSQPPKCHKSFCQPDVCLNDGQCIEMPVPVPHCENIPLKFNTSVTTETANGSVSRPCSAVRSSLGRALHVCRDAHRHCIDFHNVTLQNHLCNCSHAYHGASCEKGPYYLGGAMSWKRVHNSSNEILVSYRSQWKRGFGPCGFSCNVSDVGKGANKSVGEIVVLFNDTVVQTVDHKYHIEEVTTGQSSNDLDYEMGLGSFVIKLPNDTTDIANFSLRFQGSGWARLSWKSPDEYRLNAFGNGTFVLHNHSPAVANFKTLHYRYNWGCEHSLYLPLPDDVDGDVVRCRWATTEESGTASMGLPGAILDEENCTITFNATSDNHYQRQGLYAVNLIFEDFSDELSFSPKSSVPLQILVTTSTSSNDCNGNAIEVMEPQTSSHVLLKGSIFRMKFSIKLPADGTRPRLKIVLGPGKMRVVKEEIVDDRLETEVEWKPKPAQSGRTKFCVAAEHRGPGSLLSRLLCQVILVNVLNPCEKNPPYCKNDGDCIPLPNDTSPIPSCDCPENFLGDLCEIDAKAEFEAFHRSRALWGAKTGFEPGASDLKWWHVLIISVGGIGLVLNLLFINFVLRKRETIERDQGPLQKYKRTNQRGGRRPIISRRKVAPMPPAYNDIYNFEKKPGSFTVEPKVKPLVIPTYDELLEKNYVDN